MSDTPRGFFEGTGMPDAGWWEALWPDPGQVLDKCGLTPGMDVVDLCAGDGWFTRVIAQRAKHVSAVDIDPKLMAMSEIRLRESGMTNCTFIAGDAYDLPQLVGSAVDFVFLANAYHGVPDKPRLCRAIHDALVPGGVLAIVNWYARPREETKVLGEPRGPKTELRMTPEATIASVDGSGLVFKAMADVLPYHYAAMFQRPVRGTDSEISHSRKQER
jgi:SAM-dependent methyltransferase